MTDDRSREEGQSALTLVATAIHRPGEPRHFMRLKPVDRRVRIRHGDTLLAETTDALRLLEVGKDLYDPAFYLPPAAITCRLVRTSRTSHCPLKGDAVYFDLVYEAGAVVLPEIAWSYPEPLAIAGELAGRIAFYPDHLIIEEGPK
jgi:uncharacterized protein (DUF427 family)